MIHSALYIGTKEGMPEKGRKKEEVMVSWVWIALIVLALLLGVFMGKKVIRSLRQEEDDLAVADVEDLRDEVIQDAPTAESLRRILRASREVSLAASRRERQARLFRVLLKRRERAKRAGAEAESLQDSFYPKSDELGGDSDQQPGVVASIPAKKLKPSVVSQPPAPGKVPLDVAQTDAYNAGFALAKAGKMRPEMEAEKAKLPKELQLYFERGWLNGGSGMNPTPPTKPSPPPAPPSGQGTQPPAGGGTPPGAPGTGAVVSSAAAAAATGP